LAFVCATARAAPGNDPTALVTRLHAGIVAAGTQRWPPERQAIARLLRDSFDLPQIARAVLGAAAATQQQRDRLADVLGEGMMRQVLHRRTDPADRFDVVETRAIGPAEWLVFTRITPAGQTEVTLAWRVRAGPEGLRIMLRDGTSAVITRQQDIKAALRTRDLDAVIGELARQAAAEFD
jgi:ABC-type transporter MlaC component